MIAAIYARVLLATRGLLACAASAECAWVLWAQSVGPCGLVHRAVDGWKDLEECEKERKRQMQHPKDPTVPPVRLSCLPDTVDPRGPKTK